MALNTATAFDGGAIDSGDTAASAVTASVVRSTLDQNTAGTDGGAIDNGDGASVASALDLTDSTVTANTATTGDGGALDNADSTGVGSVLVSGTTISGNTAASGPGIDNAGGTGTVGTAADLLADACAQGTSGWTDAGYSAGDATCLAGGPGSVASTTVGHLPRTAGQQRRTDPDTPAPQRQRRHRPHPRIDHRDPRIGASRPVPDHRSAGRGQSGRCGLHLRAPSR